MGFPVERSTAPASISFLRERLGRGCTMPYHCMGYIYYVHATGIEGSYTSKNKVTSWSKAGLGGKNSISSTGSVGIQSAECVSPTGNGSHWRLLSENSTS